MALTALEIYKYLPKKNCGKCGVPTCLAFAMNLASMKAKLEACPLVSEEAKSALEASAAPPIRLVKIGVPPEEVQLGDETVLFRHEKTFYHPTCYAALVTDTMERAELELKVTEANNYRFERLGMVIGLNLLAVKCVSGNGTNFAAVLEQLQTKNRLPLVLMSDEPGVIEAGLRSTAQAHPLIYRATANNCEAMAKLAKEYKCPLAVHAATLEELATLTERLKAAGVGDLVLDLNVTSAFEMVRNYTLIRRLAIKKTFRPLGYPIMTVLNVSVEEAELIKSVIATLKYSSLVVFPDRPPVWEFYPLITLRQNIYTDPQKPIQVKPGIYPVNNPTPESPLLTTTNFSLTYFTVLSDIEKSKIPSWLLVNDTDGLSVMTSFAAGKFTAESLAKTIEDSKICEKVSHRQIIIPGLVARMSAKLKELSNWSVVVGPRESAGIPTFLKGLTTKSAA